MLPFTVVQRNNYYPFGMSFGEETDLEQGKQNFKYNGKELDKEHGLNQYDYAARFMDPSIIRFTSVDPHAENYFSWSPYVYVGNNPMRLVDPDGKDWYKNEDGTAYMWRKGNDASFTHTIGEGDNAITLEMKNIGETYVDNLADGTQIVWDQNSFGGISEPQYLSNKESSLIEKWAGANNFVMNITYNIANDLFITGQKITLGYFDKTNEFTGGGAGTNLDGSINYQEGTSLLNTIGMFSGYMTSKGAVAVGANIPQGIGYIQSKEGFWGASVINYGIELINGSISRGGIVKSIKGLNNMNKQEIDKK